VIIRRLIVPLSLAVATLHAGHAFAQSAFPAPPPGQAEAPASNDSPVAGSTSDACSSGLAPLREEAEKRGKLIKEASERHAPPDEACKLITSFGQAEIKMIKYVEANSAKCGISPRISEQLRTGHNNTEKMQRQVCDVAQQAQAGPGVGDVLDSPRRAPAGPVGDFPPYNYR
jgi:hypothetical protein